MERERSLVNQAIARTRADNMLRQVGHAVDGHIIEGGKFLPERAKPQSGLTRESLLRRKRA